MQCTKPIYLQKENLEVPCGKCRGCRISRSREWATRLIHEGQYHKYNTYVTLTYNDEHLRSDLNLEKRALVLFFKRLRERIGDRELKYYATGEYGDKEGRPHYHAIIFGINRCNNCKTCIKQRRIKGGPDKPDRDCLLLRECWTNGFVEASGLGYESARYVADYIQKKLYGAKAQKDGREQPFSIMSQGIGKQFALDNRKRITETRRLTINGAIVKIPRYYLQVLGLSGEELFKEEIQEHITKMDELGKKYGNKESMERLRDSRQQKETNLKGKEDRWKKGSM